jgi:hypothetical protein
MKQCMAFDWLWRRESSFSERPGLSTFVALLDESQIEAEGPSLKLVDVWFNLLFFVIASPAAATLSSSIPAPRIMWKLFPPALAAVWAENKTIGALRGF